MHRGGATLPRPRSELAAARRGVTLLELLVVLLLLGLAAALVAPVLRLPTERGAAAGSDPLARAADAARDLALRRGESLVLAVAPDGRWSVAPAERTAAADGAPLLLGRLDGGAPARALRVVVSALGTCVPDAPPGDAGAWSDDAVWDAAACRPAARGPAAAAR